MSSKAAVLVLLSLASQSFAAPVAQADGTTTYNNGQYVSTGTWQDGQYTWKPSTAVGTAAPTTDTCTTTAAAGPTGTGIIPPLKNSTSIIGAHTSIREKTTLATTSVKTSAATSNKPTDTVSGNLPLPTSSKATVTSKPTSTSAGSVGTGAPVSKLSGRGPAYSGDGSTADGWPAESDWISFESMWSLNVGSINSGCTGGVQNSAAETQDIHDGILSASTSYSVPSQFILAVIMQESHGCVRVGATSLGVTNPGIMQDHDGTHNCVGVAAGQCSKDEIDGMITDGVDGTLSQGANGGNGLKQEMALAATLGGSTTAQDVYIAARLYNSGDSSYKQGDNLSDPPDATASYSEDIANRMLGYVF